MNALGHKCVSKFVKMERTYLNGWRTFFKRTENIPERMEEMVRKNVS